MNTPHLVLFENAEYDIIVQVDFDEEEKIRKLESSSAFVRLSGENYINIFKSDINFLTYEHIISNNKLKKELNNEY